MGTKDNPQKSKLLTYLLVIVITAGVAQAGWSEVQAKELKGQIERQEQLLKQQEEKLEEQGSLIDQQDQQLQELMNESIHLNDALEKQKGQYEETIKLKDDQIEGLKGELAYKQATETRKERLRRARETSRVTVSRSNVGPRYKEIYFETTAYTALCDTGCTGITATGINLLKNRDAKVVAVDPRVIPLGTKLWIEGYGYALAADTGGAIKGYKLDLHVPTKAQAFEWGRRTVKVKIFE